MPPSVHPTISESLTAALDKRRTDSLFRALYTADGLVDFSSNDYLGFARSERLGDRVRKAGEAIRALGGSTGSRCLSGNSKLAEDLESRIAAFHGAEAALLFNSGYDANLGLLSCIAREGDTIVCDELVHASIIDGCRLSHAARVRFAHNDPGDLERALRDSRGNIFVVVESCYSMGGPAAPLETLAQVCRTRGAHLIVDEAHATGIVGRDGRGGVSAAGVEEFVFARVHTFGKALGCHGAAVVGPRVLRDYLVNFARSFIFSTALPVHSLFAIAAAYDDLEAGVVDVQPLFDLITGFRTGVRRHPRLALLDGAGPIQCVMVPGSARAARIAEEVRRNGFDVRAIRPPSVAPGTERLRINVHLFNTSTEVDRLVTHLARAADEARG